MGEEVVGLTVTEQSRQEAQGQRDRGRQKRREPGSSPGRAAGSQGTQDHPTTGGGSTSEILGRLPKTIGTGDHEKPILEGMAMALADLVLEVQDLKGAVYHSWRLERDSPYIQKGMQFKDLYSKKGREVKGKGINLGHMRNYVFLGLLVAAKEDEDVSQDQKETVERLAVSKVRDTQGRIDPIKASKLAGITAYCQVVRLAKTAFINILMRGEEGKQIYKILEEAFQREGELEYEGPPPKPIHKEIKLAIQGMYKERR